MKFILIAVLIRGGIPISVTGIFPSEAACESAVVKLKDKHPDIKAGCFNGDGTQS